MKALAALLLFAAPVGLLLLAASAAAAPQRVASLNLCSDELALRLAAPGQLISVSRLGADPNESTLADRAKGLATNTGRVTDIITLAPDLVLTSRGDPSAAAVAQRLGIATVELSEPQTLADVRANIRRVAVALGRRAAGEALVTEMDAALVPTARLRPALMVSGGGLTIAPDGLAAHWLAFAGLAQQRVPRGQLNLEQLLANPPQILLLTRYRSQQVSTNQRWLQHPAFAALPASTRRITTDGRAWTCLGPGLAREIARLRGVVGQ